VSTPAELLGKFVDVDVARAAEGNLDLVVAEVAEEEGQPRSTNRAGMLGYPFALLLMVLSAIAPLYWFRRNGWL